MSKIFKEVHKEFIKEKEKEVEKHHLFDKVHKDKDLEFQTAAAQADPAVPLQAAIPKFTGEKLHKELEKTHKDLEKFHKDAEFLAASPTLPLPPPRAEAALHKVVEKVHVEKFHKDKEFKIEKVEIAEKFYTKEKEFHIDKSEPDVAGPGPVGPEDPVEARVGALEAAVSQLVHFIPAQLRPDLSTGALAEEEDVDTTAGAGAASAQVTARKKKIVHKARKDQKDSDKGGPEKGVETLSSDLDRRLSALEATFVQLMRLVPSPTADKPVEGAGAAKPETKAPPKANQPGPDNK